METVAHWYTEEYILELEILWWGRNEDLIMTDVIVLARMNPKTLPICLVFFYFPVEHHPWNNLSRKVLSSGKYFLLSLLTEYFCVILSSGGWDWTKRQIFSLQIKFLSRVRLSWHSESHLQILFSEHVCPFMYWLLGFVLFCYFPYKVLWNIQNGIP